MRIRVQAAGRRLLLLLVLFPRPAPAWGPLGHRTIGVLADARLTPAGRAFVETRLDDPSLASAANWADAIRNKEPYRGSIWYHIEKIPDGATYLDNLRALPDSLRLKGGLVAAILVADATLRDPAASPAEQTDALKFLTHLVGDIHQPLHTGRPEDKGGLTIRVTWFGTPMTLHRVWDSGLLEAGRSDIAGLPPHQAAAAYAEHLERRFGEQVSDDETDIEGWLNESLALRPGAYETTYETDPEAYRARHIEEADLRLYLAGIRLARRVNDLAAGAPLPAREKELWRDVESLLGDPRKMVRLHR
ncbi:MAG: hypothetical protein KA248_00515 [Kiritimatiellae bacterium]|nr:hypothetical protein [Kiritimatiellia bacterium]